MRFSLLSARAAWGRSIKAKDTRLDRDVALKVLPEEFFEDKDRVARFRREAKSLASLNHPGIAAVHSFEEVSGRHLLVMELLEGETLRQRLSAGALPVRKAVDWGVQIARGLAAAHERGIVHRDLKPENLFVTKDERVKILDFGLAKQTPPATEGAENTKSPTLTAGTEAGIVFGTVGYMSPEQVRGGNVDLRSDIFSLGAVLHEMLSGERAFRGAVGRGHPQRDPERGDGGPRGDEPGDPAIPRPGGPPLSRKEPAGALPLRE